MLTWVPDYDRIGNYLGWVDPAAKPRRVQYAYVIYEDRLNYEVHLLGAGDEPIRVESIMRDGRHVPWEGVVRGDRQVFYPPDGSDINDGFFVSMDKRMIELVPMDRYEIERFAMRYKVAVQVP